MQNVSEEFFQIATLVVVVMTALVVFAYLLIFINPHAALNPLKPPTDTPVPVATLPSTWTPTPSNTPTVTLTPTPTTTPTLTPTDTPTLAPATATLTRRPAPARTPVASGPRPTATPSAYVYQAFLSSCEHSSTTQIKGKVTKGGQPQEGIRVRIATNADVATVVDEQLTRHQPDGSAAYNFVLAALGPMPGSWYIWVADANGNPASDPNFHIQTNNLPADNALSCWVANVDFISR